MNNPIQKTSLYRYWDVNGILLYVGVTKNPFDRQSHHAQNQPWWDEVIFGTFEHFATREEALEAEELAIGTEFPKYNKAGPVLKAEARLHLVDIMAGNFPDEDHQLQTRIMESTMMELNEFSNKPEAHKLLFAFSESIPWDEEGDERLVFCNNCQEIIDSPWFKKSLDKIHSEICDEAVGK